MNTPQEIINSFDFEKVHAVMLFYNWRWWSARGDEIPSIERLKFRALELLNEVFSSKRENYYIASGGFTAMKFKLDNGDSELTLVFNIG